MATVLPPTFDELTEPPIVLHIGKLALRSCAMLAPMAGICDSPFKRVVRRFDRYSLLSTELVNGEAWLRGSHEMAARAVLHPDETPVALQLSGHDPVFLGLAAAKAEAEGADLVDLN
jgi:tRNA-dihydrouridine synthase B